MKAMLVILLTLAQAVATPAIHRIIPAQNVQSQEKIEWLGNIPYLHGYYNVMLVIFPRRAAQTGQIKLLVYKNGKELRCYSSTHKQMPHTLRLFEIDNVTKINSGEHLEIHYEGNSSVWVREKPESFIILTLLGNDTVSTAPTVAVSTAQTVAASTAQAVAAPTAQAGGPGSAAAVAAAFAYAAVIVIIVIFIMKKKITFVRDQ